MAIETEEDNDIGNFSLSRQNALSDGVIAIAMTLLVLGIDVPDDHNFKIDGIWSFVSKLESGLAAYIASFIIISFYWMMHQRVYNVLKTSNRTIMVFNILFLFSITLIPFVSKIRTLYQFDPYAITMLALAHMFTGLILYVTWKYIINRRELLKTPESNNNEKWITRGILLIPIVCVIAIVVSFYNAHIGTYLFGVVPVVYFFFINRYKI